MEHISIRTPPWVLHITRYLMIIPHLTAFYSLSLSQNRSFLARERGKKATKPIPKARSKINEVTSNLTRPHRSFADAVSNKNPAVMNDTPQPPLNNNQNCLEQLMEQLRYLMIIPHLTAFYSLSLLPKKREEVELQNPSPDPKFPR